jgi:membrane-anchored glycerophosphoryl diester phosphodiesterase (GDPDase)
LVVLAIRFAMATPALVLEDLGVVASLRRSWALTRGRFWRTFGVLLVAGILVGIVQQVVGFGVQVVGSLLGFAVGSTLGDGGEVVAIVVTAAFVVVGSLLASMVCQPFLAAVTALLYTDARIRKEGFDLALVHAVTNPRAAG